MDSPTEGLPVPPRPGDTLSHYRLVEKIGAGGMGVVWKATDTTLGRDVAVKVLPPDFALDPTRRKMFTDEAKLASRLTDAHIAQVYELGHADGTDFIVMELVDGVSLDRHVEGQSLTPEKVADLGEQVARALSRAHRKGLIHRDLKPGNILVTEEGEAKVVDFGLATLFERADETMLTQAPTKSLSEAPTEVGAPQSLMGTIPYMSPEQVRLEKLDGRSDIFSLGSVLYEMTTGQLPFVAPTAGELMQEVRKARPTPVRELEPSMPPELEVIVSKAMAAKKEERYQHAEDLAVDLKRLRRELETGTLPSLGGVEEEPVWRRPWAWATAAVVVVAAVAIAAWIMRGPSLDPETVLIWPLEVRGQEEGAEYVGLAFAEALAQKLTVEHGIEVPSIPEPGERGDGGSQARAQVARDRGAGRVLMGSVTGEAGNVLRARITLVDPVADRIVWGTEREVEEGMRSFSSLASMVAQEVAAHLGAAAKQIYDYNQMGVTRNEELARHPAYVQALAAARRWDPVAAVPEVEKLIQAFPEEPDALLLAWEVFGNAGVFSGRPDLGEKAMEACERLEQLDPNAPWWDLCQTMSLWGHDPEGRIVTEFTNLLDRDDLGVNLRSGLLADRGTKRREQGDREGALRDLREALSLDPTNVWPHIHYGWHLIEEGRIEEGLDRLRRAFALDPYNPMATWGLGEVLFHYGEWDGARAPLRNHCEDRVPHMEQEGCAQYAYVAQRTGHGDEARVAAARAAGMEDSPDGVWVLAAYHALAGDEAQALTWLRREAEMNPTPIFLRGHLDFSSLHGNPEFEELAAAELKEAVAHYGQVCASDARSGPCALHAVALHLSGRPDEAQEVAARAATLAEVDPPGGALLALAWYHALARDRDEVIRYLRQRSELPGITEVPAAWAYSTSSWRLAEHRDYAWLRGDPEFDDLAARLDAQLPGGPDDGG